MTHDEVGPSICEIGDEVLALERCKYFDADVGMRHGDMNLQMPDDDCPSKQVLVTMLGT